MKASDIRKALIDAQIDVPMEQVPVPEAWRPHLNGVKLFMRGFTASEWDTYVRALAQENGDGFNTLRLLVALIVDENGDRVFTGDDVKVLAEHPGSVIQELQETALRVSGLKREEQDFGIAQAGTTFTE